MNFSEPFIRRPVMTTLVMVALLLAGVLGYKQLPTSALPAVDFPTIVVSAGLPGARPETMASAVATPLERQFSSVAGIDSMNSTSSLGSTQITLQFSLDRNIDAAAQDVQAAISAAVRQLPQEMPSPPSFRKVNPSDAPILYIALRSDTITLSELDRYAETYLSQRISTVLGVAQVNVFGPQKYAVRIQLDPDKLTQRDLSMEDVIKAIQQANVNLPTGVLNQGKDQSFLIQVEGQLYNAEAYQELIIAYKNDAPIRLKDIGKALDSVEKNMVASWFNKDRAIILAIKRQPGSNTIEVVKSIKKILPAFEAELPQGVEMEIVFDRSESIQDSVSDVQFTLLIAAVLVVLVIFIFLRNLSATIIPSLAIPMCIISTFAVMALLDYSLDNLSLLALILSVGFVVDDAIVMLENIVRYLEKGYSPLEATLKGSKEISFTILSMTLSLAVVFLPVVFMGGVLGRLLREFSITICVTILVSGFVSLTLSPMLCSRFLKMDLNKESKTAFHQKSEYYFNSILKRYEKSLLWVLQNRFLTLCSFFASLVLVAGLFMVIPKGFITNEDTGQILGYTSADSSISFQSMVELQKKLAEIVQQDPNVKNVVSSVGSGGVSVSTNSGFIFMRLKPMSERKLRSDKIIQNLRKRCAEIPGIRIYLQDVPSINLGGKLSKSTYQYTLEGTNLAELNKWSEIYKNKMNELPGFIDVTSDLEYTGPQILVTILRDKAAALGVSPAQIETALYNAFGSNQISSIYTAIDTYQVILEILPDFQKKEEDLSKIYLRSSLNETLVPLSTVTKISKGIGALTVNHQGQLPAVTVSFNLKPEVAMGQAVDAINKLEQDLKRPKTITGHFQGSAQVFKSSLQGLGLLLLAAIVTVYIILGILYESFVHPLTILSGLPAAGAGALITLLIFQLPLDLYSFVGLMMLTGIVKKNAIMMIDFAIEAQRDKQTTPAEAIFQACLLRFRPIMMTTMSTLVGSIPIALGLGAGAESRMPLGLVVIGGLILSQILTLYITPVIYLYFERSKT